jgi:hypothetical protein
MLNDEDSVLNQINSDSYSDNKLQPEANSSVAHKVISNKLWSSPADASVIAQLEPSGQCQLSEVKQRKPLSAVNNDSSSVAIVLNSSNVSPQRFTRLVEHLAESKQKCMFCRKSKYVKCTNTREPLMLATAHCYQEAVNQLDDQHGRNAVEMYYHKTCHRNNTHKPNQTTSVLFEDTYKAAEESALQTLFDFVRNDVFHNPDYCHD